MATEEIKREYEELVQTIKHHMDLYYSQDTPEISDYGYDQLMQRLKAIERENPAVLLHDPAESRRKTNENRSG